MGTSLFTLSEKEFQWIRDKVRRLSGISLSTKKKQLVVSRLSKRLRALGLDSFAHYINYLRFSDPDAYEAQELINRISTNKTDFFRESHHFTFLSESFLPSFEGKKLRIWSAGCSTGEEPYSIAITIQEHQRKTSRFFPWELVASDIATDALQKAAHGIYRYEAIEHIDRELQERYFLRGKGKQEGMVRVKNSLRSKLSFQRINLMDEPSPISRGLDLIFLRNVIIYFDYPTKQRQIERMETTLRSGGYLFLGHSESLHGISSNLEFVGRTIYRKQELIRGWGL